MTIFRKHTFLVLLIGFCIPLIAFSKPSFYKWVDEEGVTHYSAEPPPSQSSEEIRLPDQPSATDTGKPSADGESLPATFWNPEITIIAPKTTGDARVVPISVKMKGVPANDHVAQLAISLPNNPNQHRQLLAADFSKFLDALELSIRARMSGSLGVVNVVATSKSGQIKKQAFRCTVKKGADFYVQESSSSGKQIARVETEFEAAGLVEIDGWLTHRMEPRRVGTTGHYVKDVEIRYRNELLAKMVWGDSVSRNPFLRLRFRDSSSELGKSQIKWRDTDGNEYQAAD
ncbi:MAG: thiosulfate oxidation carrier complex protein SoxZ [Sedimenticolaceae bacterium]